MSFAGTVESTSIEQLREIGSIKWTMFPDTIGAFVAEMDLGTAPQITRALHRTVDQGLFGYLPPQLSQQMAEACAAWQQERYGWEVQPDDVKVVPDVLSALSAALDHFSAPGSKVILPTPAYMPFLKLPGMHGREIIEVPMLHDGERHVFDLEAIDRAFAAGGGLFVLCNPYNPLGRVFESAELEALSQVVAKHGGRVFSDEIHAPIVFAPHQHVPYASLNEVTAGHTLTATSASKAWNLPGLKAAQVILSSAADADVWARPEVSWASHGASNLGVVANAVAYSQARDWQADALAYLDENRHYLGQLLAEHLPQVRYTAPEGSYIAWLDARDLGITGSPAAFFREHAGVSLTDGIDCGTAGEGHLRFVFATTKPIIEQAVRQMGEAMARVG